MFVSRKSEVKRAISRMISIAVVVIVIVIIAVGAYAAVTLSGTSMTTTQTTTTSSASVVSSTTSLATTTTSTPATTRTTTTTTTTTSSANLTQLAKAEGTITIYTTVDAAAFTQYIASAFKQSYPWATVNVLHLSSGDLLSKVLAEAKSGAVQSDVVQTVGADFPALINADTLLAYPNPSEANLGYPPSVLDSSNYAHPFDVTEYPLCYNTNLITNTSMLPTSWLNLTNPIWNGKIALDNPARLSATGGLFAILKQNMTQSQWMAYLQGIAANKPFITTGSGGVYSDVSTGTAAIGDCAGTDIVANLAKGAPIGYEWLNPIPLNVSPMGISNNAPHPYMAQLFIQWITSVAGQDAIGGAGRSPALPSAAASTFLSKLPTPIPTSYTELNFIPILNANSSFYSSTYTTVFG